MIGFAQDLLRLHPHAPHGALAVSPPVHPCHRPQAELALVPPVSCAVRATPLNLERQDV